MLPRCGQQAPFIKAAAQRQPSRAAFALMSGVALRRLALPY